MATDQRKNPGSGEQAANVDDKHEKVTSGRGDDQTTLLDGNHGANEATGHQQLASTAYRYHAMQQQQHENTKQLLLLHWNQSVQSCKSNNNAMLHLHVKKLNS